MGDLAIEAVLVAEGEFVFSRATEMIPFTRGALLADMRALLHGALLSTTLQCQSSGTLYYVIERTLLIKFLEDNPGLKVMFMDRRFIE